MAWVRNNAPGLDVHIMHLFPKSTDNIKKVRFFAVKDYEKALFYKNGEFVGEVRGGIYEIEKQAQTKGTEIVWFDTSINEMPWGFPAENGFPTLDNSMIGLFGDMKLRLSDVRVFYQDVVGGGNEWTLQDLKDWIKSLLQTSLRDIFKRYELDQILREDRETVIRQVGAKVAEEFSQYGLILESFNILGIKSPASSPNPTELPSKTPITFKTIGQKIAEFAENIQGQMKKAWGKVVDAFAPETPQTGESPSPEPFRANDNFSNLLARANEHVAHAKKFFSEGYFLKSRVAWEKAGKDFWKSLEIAPSATESGKINQNIISTTINQCQALLEAANQAGKRGDDLHQKGKLTKARQEYQEAIRLNALAFNFIEKNPTVSFPVQPDAIRRKTHKHEIKLQQLSIEDKCVQADVKLDVAQHCQDDPHLLTEGLTSTSDALVLLNEAKLEAKNAPELAEVANIVQNKMVQARDVQQALQDRMDSLLNIVPTTAVSLDDTDANQTPAIFTTIKPASPPNPKTREKGIKMLREYEFVGGQVRFKVSIHNQTSDVLTDITILFRIPDALKWVAHDPDYSRKGDAVTIPKIGTGEKKTVSLYLEPINCLKSALNASITFFDGKNRPHAIPMEPKEITITCPIFFTREQVNLARVKSLVHVLSQKDQKVLPIIDQDHLSEIFTIALAAIGQHDVKLVDQTLSLDAKTGEAWFYAITKVGKKKMVIHVRLDGTNRTLTIEVAGDEQEKITSFLAEIEGNLRQSFLTEQIIKAGTQFYDIKTSILLGICPFCGASIPPATLQSFKDGNDIKCPYCDSIASPQF